MLVQRKSKPESAEKKSKMKQIDWLFGQLIAFRDVFPIDDIPDFLDIISTNILVLQIVGVFPNINP
jgi:hypothetical protein